MPQSSPLSIQELLDRCIHFLSASHVDLRSCSLVARSWIHPAQFHLFRSPQLTAARPGADGYPIPRAKIEILDLALSHETVHLASFPKLTTLRITIPEALKEPSRLVLATIPPSNHIRTIVIGIESWPLDEAECSSLDEHLSCSPLSGPVVIEFESPSPQNEATEEVL